MIPRPGRIQVSFASGELDPLMRERSELKYYASGAGHAENVQFMPQGGFRLRDALRDVGAVDDDAARLMAFTNSQGAAYDVVLSPGAAAIWGEAALVDNVALPYATAALTDLTFAQRYDTAFFFHVDHAPCRLKQTASDVFSVDTPALENLPNYDYGGTYTNGVAAAWDVQFIGAGSTTQFVLTVNGEDTYALTYNSGGLTLATQIEAAVLAMPAVDAGAFVSAISAAMMRITFAGDGNEGDDWAVSARILNSSSVAAPCYKRTVGIRPGEAVISATRGWPACGAFGQQRLLLGGLKSLPSAWIASQTGDYFNFDDRIDTANGPMLVPMDAPGGERIERIVVGRNTMIFTSNGEYWLSDREIDKTKPPNHVKASSVGIRRGVPVAESEGAAIFIARTGSVVSEFRYNDVDGNFATTGVSLLAASMIEDVRDAALRNAELSIDGNTLGLVLGSGEMRFATLLREQEVTAFARVTASGDFKAVSVNGRNEMSVLFDTANGRRLARFERDLLLDRAVDWSGAATDTLTGLSQFEGEEVWVLTGAGDVLGPFTVDDATVILPIEVTAATIGTWTPPVVETLPLPREIGPRIVNRKKARIHSVWLSLYDTTSVALEVNSNGKIYDVPLRRFGDLADIGELNGGFTGLVGLNGFTGFQDEPTVRITQTRPGRLTVRSITLSADF